jgi:glutamate/tyrosine decarboxylase-like PLP-dependent enzyme
VAAQGLVGAPPLKVFAGEEAHITVYGALRLLGLGDASVVKVAVDGQGRMLAAALREKLALHDGPAIVCAQAGNVNTGAFDPLDEIAHAAQQKKAWVHVDGAFGLWAAASPHLKKLTKGLEQCDSWATDAHKWLNVPYDSGLAFVRDTSAHRAAMARSASYLQRSETERDNYEWTPEFSRRARGFNVYAALRSLGRRGVEALVDRSCAQARLFAELLTKGGAQVLNDVVLNQVLVRLPEVKEVIARVQQDGTCWLSGTVWRGEPLMRISVCNWSTTDDDVRRSADAILSAAAARTR